MSYTAKVFYVLESDPTYTLKYDSHVKDVNIGDSFSLSFLDFDYNGTHYYVKYAINNGSVYKRGVNTIDCKSMMISDDYRYMSWYVFCTEDETDITGDCAVSYTDIATELYLSISTGNSDSVSTRGKETLISVSISQGCVSDSFASYGSTYSPTMSCEMYAENNDFTDALIAKTYYDNTLKGTIVNAWILIGNEFAYPVPIGRFVVKENPTYNGDTVSFNGNGLMSEYMDRAEIVISSLNEYHKTELEEKYVPSQLQFIYTRDDVYYWEYLPQDFLRVTGCPLYIDNWKDVLSSIKQYKLYHLMIPMLSNFADNDEDGYDWDWESRITWRDLLSGIAVLLRANVIEKNGAFYIKQLPELQTDNNYRPIFNGDTYDSNAIFGNNLMCPNNVSVKANNWYFYETNSDYVGFGYYEGESTVVLNDKASSVSNVENYPVTIETPWILYETLDRNTVHTYLGQVTPMQWKTGLSFLNKAFVYHKASIETMYWHPLMSVGEMLTFEDYDGVKKYVLVGEMTLHYDGGFYAEITSPCEVQESNASSVGSSGSSSYNSGTMAQASGTVTSTILGAIFKDGVITNSKIADSTIENSKIKDSTITNAKIADATIEWEKVSKSFITDLTADNAYIEHLKATIGEFGYITAENADLTYATITSLRAVDGKIDTLTAKAITTDNLEAKVATLGYLSAESADVKFATIESLTAVDGKIDTLSSKAITTENLSAKVADLGYLSADSADLKYANIKLSNIEVADIATLFAEVGLIDRATIVEGHITGFLDSVEVNAANITAGTLVADRILLKGENGLLYSLNNLGELQSKTVDTLDGYILTDRTVNADKIVAKSITANELDVEKVFADSAVIKKIFSQDVTATGTITGATLKGANAEIDNGLIGGFNIKEDGISKAYTKSSSEASEKQDSYELDISSNGIPSFKGTGQIWKDNSTKVIYESIFDNTLTIDQYMFLNNSNIKQSWFRTKFADSYAGNITISELTPDGVVRKKTSYGLGYVANSLYENGELSETFPFTVDSPLKIHSNHNASLTNYDLQISSNTGNHMNLGQRTIQAVDKNNAATTLYLNSYGGSISIGRVNGAGTTTLNANVAFEKHCSSVTTTTPSSTILYGITMNGGLFKAVVFRDYSIASASPWASIVQTELMPGDSGATDVVQYHNMVTGRGECVRVAFNAKTGNLAVNAQYNTITNDNLNGIAIFPVLQ
jgi:hypothetical phage structural protein